MTGAAAAADRLESEEDFTELLSTALAGRAHRTHTHTQTEKTTLKKRKRIARETSEEERKRLESRDNSEK